MKKALVWATAWLASQAGDGPIRNLKCGSGKENNEDFITWGDDVLAEQAEGKDRTAVRLCCSPLWHPHVWLIINGQLLQKWKRYWNDNSIKGADGPMSKCFTKDWVDIRLISQWLKSDSWCPMRWNLRVLLYCVARGQEYSWLCPHLKI